MRLPVAVALLLLSAPAVGSSAGAQAASRSAVDTTITVRASSSTLEFDPPAIAAKHGSRVRIRFMNAGTLPHNFVLVRNENDIDEMAAAAMKQGGDYIPAALKGKMIAFTTLASPGQTLDVIFVMPPPGVYTYVCLMSGHANSMTGLLRSLR